MEADGDGRVRRGREEREARRAQILETALQVFAEKGYHGASITDVVSAAGVARGTFYLYFDSKEAIFHELLDQLLRHVRGNVVGVDLSGGGGSVRDQLEATVARLLRVVESNRPLTRIIFREAVALDEVVDRKLGEFYGDLQRYIARALEVGQALGLVRPLDAAIAATCVLACLRGVVQTWVVEREEALDVAALSAAVVEFALAGVGAPATGAAPRA